MSKKEHIDWEKLLRDQLKVVIYFKLSFGRWPRLKKIKCTKIFVTQDETGRYHDLCIRIT
jgi:hypothetical protein